MKGKLTKITGIYTFIEKDDKMIASDDEDMQKDYQIGKLSKQNCDEIFGVGDVEKLANTAANGITFLEFDKRDKAIQNKYYSEGFKLGFKEAMELNKDKVFTLEDMFNLYAHIVKKGIISGEEANEFIQSLQQPTEIEVEIEMELEIDTSKLVGAIYGHKPKLDSEGCLILKKI